MGAQLFQHQVQFSQQTRVELVDWFVFAVEPNFDDAVFERERLQAIAAVEVCGHGGFGFQAAADSGG